MSSREIKGFSLSFKPFPRLTRQSLTIDIDSKQLIHTVNNKENKLPYKKLNGSLAVTGSQNFWQKLLKCHTVGLIITLDNEDHTIFMPNVQDAEDKAAEWRKLPSAIGFDKEEVRQQTAQRERRDQFSQTNNYFKYAGFQTV